VDDRLCQNAPRPRRNQNRPSKSVAGRQPRRWISNGSAQHPPDNEHIGGWTTPRLVDWTLCINQSLQQYVWSEALCYLYMIKRWPESKQLFFFPTESIIHRADGQSPRRIFHHRSNNGRVASNLFDFILQELACFSMHVSYQLWVHLIFMSLQFPNATFPSPDWFIVFRCVCLQK